jgi:xylene monooxygenase electron transfer component
MFSWFKRRPASAGPGLPGRADDGRCELRIQGSGEVLRVPRDGFLLASAIEQGLAYPHNCRVGTCGQCKTRLVSGQIKPMMDFALSPLTADELRQGYVLACQSKVRSDLVIAVALGAAAPPVVTRQATVLSAERLAGDVLSLRLALAEPLVFAAGQFADLAIADSGVRRSYSFCDRPEPGGNGEVSFLIKRLPGGQLSERLFALARAGLAMQLHGPFGALGTADADAHALCVAGGTGLAPMLSILRDRLRRSGQARYTLIFGVRSLQDHFAQALLDQLVHEARGRLQVQVVLADEPAGSAWPGARGLVTTLITPAAVQALPARAAFLCGAAGMVDAARRQLLSLGLPPEAIHADGFSPSGAAVAPPPPPTPARAA